MCENDGLWSGIGAQPADLYDVLINVSILEGIYDEVLATLGVSPAERLVEDTGL